MAKPLKQTDVFPNILIGYTIVWPFLAATLFILGLRLVLDESRHFVYDVYLFIGLCVFEFLPALFSGTYVARRVVKRQPIRQAHYYLFTVLGALSLPTLIFDILKIKHMTNGYDTQYGTLSFAASFGLTSLVLGALACLCAWVFLAITEHLLNDTPFAIQYNKTLSLS